MKHLIPDAALDKHVALLGMTGAGKSSVIKTAIVEPDLEEDRRVLIITPKDDWWGLRLSKSGKSKGYDIPIFGGWHGDYPLLVKDAALLAETYGTMKGSAIFCTSRLSVQDRARWFAAFAETFLAKNRGWVRVVIDEAHVFMPKQGGKGGGAIPAALHAGNELVSQGRSPGMRIVLASQRSAKLHNDSLTQCACLVAMQLMAPHDRDAVKDWIVDQADPETGKEIIASLASLNTGEAWVWAPRAKMLKRIQFPWPTTFDSSKAADDDAGSGPQLAPINLDALKGKLATIEAEKQANDPKALKAENAALKAQHAALTTEISKLKSAKPAVDPDSIEKAEARGYEQAKKQLAAENAKEVQARVTTALETAHGLLAPALAGILEAVKANKKERPDLKSKVAFIPPARVSPAERTAPSAPRRSAANASPSGAKPSAVASGDGSYSRSQTKVLGALALWRTLGHDMPSREQVAALAGYSPTASTFNNLLGGLRTLAAVDYPQGGRVSLAAEFPAPSVDEGRDTLVENLTGPQRKIISALVDRGQRTREEVAGDTDYSVTASTFNNLLGSLRTLGLIDYPAPGFVIMTEWAQELLTGYPVAMAA